IANALKNAGGDMSEAMATEVLPMAVGAATGGAEGGVLAGIAHKTASAVYSPLKTRSDAAFNAAIERAAIDPLYARQLVSKLPTAPYSAGGAARLLARAITRTNAVPAITAAQSPASH